MSFEEAKKLDDHFVMHTFARKPVLLVEGSGMELTLIHISEPTRH